MEENKNGTQEQPEQKKKKKSDVILTIALVVAIAVFCYAAYNLYHIYTEYRKGTNEYNSIEEMAVTERDPDSTEVAGPDAQPKPPIDVDFEKLKSINDDVIGWIYVDALPDISSCRERTIRHIFIRPMRRIIILQERSLWITKMAEISMTVIHWSTDIT